MILNFSIVNFRSIKDEVIFSLVAESSKSKEQNVFVQPLANGKDEVRLLKSAVLYGANGSGKSNVIRALDNVVRFITKNQNDLNDNIIEFEHFAFEENSYKTPAEFCIEFIGKDSIKYKYILAFDMFTIIKENLSYYPNKIEVNIFKRNIETTSIHKAKLGVSFKKEEFEIFANRTILSDFGKNRTNEIIGNVYLYFKKIIRLNSFLLPKDLIEHISESYTDSTIFSKKLNALIKIADVGIDRMEIEKIKESEFSFPNDFSIDEKNKIINSNKYRQYALHKSFGYNSDSNTKFIGMPLHEESQGTQNLFKIGGLMLIVIEHGGVLFIDELETAFHPHLVQLLISMFHNPKINKKNAQLIFTTHDTNLMDSSIFRKDQVWFTEKNEQGVTELFSLQDFPEVREDTKFDKWYLAGKFGAIPNLQSLEALYDL
jgi:AAA15 family ATPase/GTPase